MNIPTMIMTEVEEGIEGITTMEGIVVGIAKETGITASTVDAKGTLFSPTSEQS